MKKQINNKGFAISTMVYGLVFITIAVFYLIITIEANRHQNNTNFVNDVREQLNAS